MEIASEGDRFTVLDGVIPVVHMGTLFATRPMDLSIHSSMNGEKIAANMIDNKLIMHQIPTRDFVVTSGRDAAPHTGFPIQVGGWVGSIDWQRGNFVTGHARNLRNINSDVTVIAFLSDRIVSTAVAKANDGGAFVLSLPELGWGVSQRKVMIGIVGSDYILDGAPVMLPSAVPSALRLQARPLRDLAIRIKISTPNLKEAPSWGDYHFANSLKAAFDKLGQFAAVDTADDWYGHRGEEDVVITLRGRHRFNVDRSRTNIMWLISHPDKISDEEYADYDHIAVASDVYAVTLRSRGFSSVSVVHQATDKDLFLSAGQDERAPVCLFVGNSRREYRTMVKWCVQNDIKMELHGGGWDGILPREAVSSLNVPNSELPSYYGSRLIVLNDHWDSMRDNGFLSNRLFDASAAGAPIITDPVEGLSEVFGDTITVVENGQELKAAVDRCMADPKPFLEKAQQARSIVLSQHTFDHRVEQLNAIIERVLGQPKDLS